MKRINIISILTALFAIAMAALFSYHFGVQNNKIQTIKVGFIYSGDESTPYTFNFIRSQHAVEAALGDRVETYVQSNINVENSEKAFMYLINNGCNLIFTTSSQFCPLAKELAGQYPDVEFCAASADNVNEEPFYSNYHTFMGTIYEGRYVSGVIAGLKIKQMIEYGVIHPDEAIVGYVASFPNAEVISGFTAFILGVRSQVPQAVMKVKYTNTWTNYSIERKCAEDFISEGCVLISQHSDTIGPAIACENARKRHPIYHIGYNQSMLDIAPGTSLTSTRINWTPYFLGAIEAVLSGESIEKHIDATINGNDARAGFDKDWVQIVDMNSLLIPRDTPAIVDETIKQLKNGEIMVFEGDYTGVDPSNPEDTIDLSKGYVENKDSSVPTFHYILNDIITVEQ
ncbi:MAG: BMP family ABC transporter substrate-binding protein [Lachnospiraceae bacterium]|nr:BMP family ABC transporter substrate-binding protein [Lachnospiraceae bacterium]